MSRVTVSIAAVLIPALLPAEIIRVPQDQPTIQGAFGQLADSDTVLVADGEYAEHLIAPQLTFWLFGDVPVDTGDFSRPIVDASLLPDSIGCLTLGPGSKATVERFRFRNRVDMFPRQPPAGGVYLDCDTAIFRDCAFDSLCWAINQSTHPNHQANYVVLDHCNFRYQLSSAYLAGTAVIAEHCLFSGITGLFGLSCGSGSRIQSCQFERADWNYVVANGENIVLQSCVFGPGSSPACEMVVLSHFQGRLENNLFHNSVLRFGVELYPQGPGGTTISGNTFYNCRTGGYPNTTLLCVFCDQPDNGTPYSVEFNTMSHCTTGYVARAISAQGAGTFNGNRVHDLGNHAYPAVLSQGTNSIDINQNLVYNTGVAVRANLGGGPLDARWNWWGDSTGPFNADSNAAGLGDTVGNNIRINPWLPDSMLETRSEAGHELPESFRIETYPNPANNVVRIRFAVPQGNVYELAVYDILGRKAAELWHGPALNIQEVTWEAGDAASGIYFVQLTEPIGRRVCAVEKVVLLK